MSILYLPIATLACYCTLLSSPFSFFLRPLLQLAKMYTTSTSIDIVAPAKKYSQQTLSTKIFLALPFAYVRYYGSPMDVRTTTTS
eukprot:scaffold8037_cov36-Tisochrysis_lutea.AAC.2